MNKNTVRKYRDAREATMRSTAKGNLQEYECVNLRVAAVELAEEVLVDLAVRAERRRARKVRR